MKKSRDDCETTEHEHDKVMEHGKGSRAMQRAHRAAAARCNYIMIDRPDLQHASKEAARRMAHLRNMTINASSVWQNT